MMETKKKITPKFFLISAAIVLGLGGGVGYAAVTLSNNQYHDQAAENKRLDIRIQGLNDEIKSKTDELNTILTQKQELLNQNSETTNK